jgi:hypothetical protein
MTNPFNIPSYLLEEEGENLDSRLYSNEGQELNFAISRIDGTKRPSIIKAYLRTVKITEEDLVIGQIKDDGIHWPLYPDFTVAQAITESLFPIKCIVSFQIHTWGKAAIARLYKDMKGVK